MPSDEMLAQQVQHGDREALAVLVERHHSALLGYLFRMTKGNRALAEDLVQETFLRVLRSIQQYQPHRPFKSWLYAIATNITRDYYKRADTRKTVAFPEEIVFKDTGRLHPERLAAAADEARQVLQAINSLPTHQYEVFVLRYYEDLSLAEISEILSIPVGTVKSRLSLGLKQLRKIME